MRARSSFLVFCVIAGTLSQILKYSDKEWVQQCTGGCLNSSSVGSFCADVVHHTFCSCKPIPATDGQENGVLPVCGPDRLARSFYLRGTGTATKSGSRPTSNSQKCKDALKEWACLSVHSTCVDGVTPEINYKDVCREQCWSIKRACSTQEQCMDLPVTECTGLSDSSKIPIPQMTTWLVVMTLLTINFVNLYL